jgi:autotransporter-associated beta strand protein
LTIPPKKINSQLARRSLYFRMLMLAAATATVAPMRTNALDTIYDPMDQISPWQVGGAAAGATILAVDPNISTTGLGSLNMNVTFSLGATFVDLYWDSLGVKDFSENIFQLDFRTSDTNAKLLWRLGTQSGPVYEALGVASTASTFTSLSFLSSSFSGTTANLTNVNLIQLRFIGDDLATLPQAVDYFVDNLRIDAYRNVGTGQSATLTNVINGTGGLYKDGAGLLTVTSSNSYTGLTTVANGELRIDGSLADSAVDVLGGATLSGTGKVGSTTIASGGTISPGNSPGELTINGDLTWSGGGNYDWEILSLIDGAGNGWDLITVENELLLSNLSSTNKFNINLFSLSGANTPGALGGFNNQTNYTWTILSAGTNIAGFDANYFNLNVSDFAARNTLGGGIFALALDGGNLQLTYSAAVPEPGTWAASLVLCLGAALVLARRRRALSTQLPHELKQAE